MPSRDSLGPCPQCGADVGSVNVLIRYEFDGEPAAWAECPHCRVIVDPIRGAGSTAPG